MPAILLFQCRQSPKQFTLISADDSGLDFRNQLTETQHNNIMTYEYSYNGGGVAAGDVNGDGLADVYFSGNSVPNKLFINKGEWHFEDVTATSKTAGRTDWKTGVAMADVNADGWLDIYVCYSGNAPDEGYERPVIKDHPKRSNQLFINNGCEPGGTPTFTESAKAYGLDAPGTFSTQSYFLDYDLDGDLDMFLLNHANMFYSAFLNTRRLRNLRHPYFGNKLYRNDTNGSTPRFTEVSDETGIHGSGLNFGLSASISDLNDDFYPDIYVTNDYEEQDFCYINNGDGTFREASKTLFGHLSKYGMGSDIADINNDGFQDVVVVDMLPEDNRRQKLLKGPDEYDRYNLAVDSGYHHQYMRNTLQLNRGFAADTLPRFSEIGEFAGISNTDWSWAPLLADFDNDGLKDLFVSNGFLRDFNNLDFIKYNADAYQEARISRRSIDYLKLIQQLPSTKLHNYIFKNEQGIRFTDASTAWAIDQLSVSNGAIYADLDNDGDYDLITNNLNGESFLYRNNQEAIQANNYLKIKLQGTGLNTAGLGAKVWVAAGDKEIFQEAWFSRGFQSSVEPVMTVGIGKAKVVDEVKVRWPDGRESVLRNITANATVTVLQKEALTVEKIRPPSPNRVILQDVSDGSGLTFTHRENKFIDFKVQRLLHYQVSRLGGKFAKGDVNNDGNDDVYFGGATGQPGVLFLGRNDGTFLRSPSQPWAADALAEDTNALFFDADADGDQDLYVVSGGSEFVSAAPVYQDRVYVNRGNGVFEKSDTALPIESISGSHVSAADYDKDGDLDLFVGGRLAPGNYGLIPRSFILQNDSDNARLKFTDVTSEHADILSTPGMVTSAVWTDYNEDTWPDLILAGEWMPIRIFENQKGKLVERNNIPALDKSDGWWCSIYATDIDSDGDTDYLLGNAGSNMQFKASPEEPAQLFAWDFNNDGVLDPIINYYIQGESFPLASRDELLDQVSSFRKKFIKYEDYADARMQDIASPEQLEKAYKFNAYILESSWLENVDGKDFLLHALPDLAQFSAINGFVSEDLTGNGKKEVIAAGNFYPFKPQLGRSDASYGVVLTFDNGIKMQDGVLSDLWLSGDIRDIDILNFKSGTKRILVSRNDGRPGVYSIVPRENVSLVMSVD